MTATPQLLEDAFLLVASVRSALLNGTRHYLDGDRLLTNEAEIVRAVLACRNITTRPSGRQKLTTETEQLEIVRREYHEKHRRSVAK